MAGVNTEREGIPSAEESACLLREEKDGGPSCDGRVWLCRPLWNAMLCSSLVA